MLKALTTQQIAKIINAAEELNAKYPASDSITDGSSVTVDDLKSSLDHERLLAQEIEALGHAGRMELIALIWIGRGDGDDFDAALRHAKDEAMSHSYGGAIDYILAKSPVLPNYLRNGMKKLGL